jgi:hypothetical protein
MAREPGELVTAVQPRLGSPFICRARGAAPIALPGEANDC